MVSLGSFTAEIEIPERVEVFRADGSETEFAYPVRVVAKHLARWAHMIGGRWIFEVDGRGYYIKDVTLTAFGVQPNITEVPVRWVDLLRLARNQQQIKEQLVVFGEGEKGRVEPMTNLLGPHPGNH